MPVECAARMRSSARWTQRTLTFNSLAESSSSQLHLPVLNPESAKVVIVGKDRLAVAG